MKVSPPLTRAISKASKAAFFLCSIFLLLAGAALTVRGQSALDGFDPNANGFVYVVVVQPDGKILLGGSFTTLAPNGGPTVTRNHIARLNPDGTLDTAFNPNANSDVYAIAVQADGKILAGGAFTYMSGIPRATIARLDPITGVPDSFRPNTSPFDDNVRCLAVQPDGKILAGGAFNIAGRVYIVRLDPVTGLADSFNPNPNGEVRSIVVQADGKILAGGFFTNIGGQTRNRIARLDASTGLADSFDPNANGTVHGNVTRVSSITVQADGKILAGGVFASIGGQTRRHIARLDATTGLADSFDPNANGIVDAITVQTDGKILVVGNFDTSQGQITIGGQTRNYIARLDPVTGLADSFNPNLDNTPRSIAVQADGKILVGGTFTTVGGQTRNYIARLEKDGRLDQTLVDPDLIMSISSGDSVSAMAVQPDGKILIGGGFTSVQGVPRNRIARLNTDSTLDTAFDPNANGRVKSIAVLADGKILAVGAFTTIGGQPRNNIARLDATGTADSFDPNANGAVNSIAVQADGKILVGGLFHGANSIGGQSRNNIARLDPHTGAADSFDPNANNAVNSIVVEYDGKILAGGTFTTIGGQTRRVARLDPITGLADSVFNPISGNGEVWSIAVQTDSRILISAGPTDSLGRWNSDGTFDSAFRPNVDTRVYSISPQPNSKILLGGNFNRVGVPPISRSLIARVDANGTPDSFDSRAAPYYATVTPQADGKILVGGVFFQLGGRLLFSFGRLNNDIAALQNLAVTQTAITWTRGGSSPQFTRVTFEFSSDNVTYSPLGYGTVTGDNWTLTGLSFPTGENFYVRARGYYRGGFGAGSESIAESVRNVYLREEVTLTSVASRKIHGATAFDIDLPTGGKPGVECRSGGSNGDHQLIFSFANPLVNVGNANVTSGAGSVSSQMIDADPHNYIVNLTGVSNAQVISVSLTNVNDSAGHSVSSVPVSMGVLLGDTGDNGVVNATDLTKTKGQVGVPLNDHNFREDVNASGSINATDVGIVKLMSGTALPSNEAIVSSKNGLFSSPNR